MINVARYVTWQDPFLMTKEQRTKALRRHREAETTKWSSKVIHFNLDRSCGLGLSFFLSGRGAKVYGDATLCFERLQGGRSEEGPDGGGGVPGKWTGVRQRLDELDGKPQLHAPRSEGQHLGVERGAGEVARQVQVPVSKPGEWLEGRSFKNATQLSPCQPRRLVVINGTECVWYECWSLICTKS